MTIVACAEAQISQRAVTDAASRMLPMTSALSAEDLDKDFANVTVTAKEPRFARATVASVLRLRDECANSSPTANLRRRSHSSEGPSFVTMDAVLLPQRQGLSCPTEAEDHVHQCQLEPSPLLMSDHKRITTKRRTRVDLLRKNLGLHPTKMILPKTLRKANSRPTPPPPIPLHHMYLIRYLQEMPKGKTEEKEKEMWSDDTTEV